MTTTDPPERISTQAELDDQAARADRARGLYEAWPPLPGEPDQPPRQRAVHRDMARRDNDSGRDQPRPDTTPVTHDVRFWGNLNDPGGLFVTCKPCDWAIGIQGGHIAGELLILTAQHSGLVTP